VVADVRVLFDEQGRLKPFKSLTAEEASLIAGFEVTSRMPRRATGTPRFTRCG
jgi:hypothetical protein